MNGVGLEVLHIFLYSVLYGDDWCNLQKAIGPISLHHIKILQTNDIIMKINSRKRKERV
jgi:hypothetical protein